MDIAIKISPPCSPSFVRQFVPLITGRNVVFLTETLPSAEYPLSLSGALHRRLFAMRQADHLQLSKWHAVPPKHVRQSIASRVLGGLNADECPAAISPECAACSMCRGRSADWASLLTARHPSTAVAAATTREWQAHSASGYSQALEEGAGRCDGLTEQPGQGARPHELFAKRCGDRPSCGSGFRGRAATPGSDRGEQTADRPPLRQQADCEPSS